MDEEGLLHSLSTLVDTLRTSLYLASYSRKLCSLAMVENEEGKNVENDPGSHLTTHVN